MNKLTTLALAGLVAVAATASASVSRWNGFGAAQAYIADVQDIWTLPGAVSNYKNSTYIELGKNTLGIESGENQGITDTCNDCYGNAAQSLDLAPNRAWGGVQAEVGPGVLGIWFNRPYAEGGYDVIDDQFNNPNYGNANNSKITPDQTLDVLYGFNLSDSTTLGVSLSRAVYSSWSKYEYSNGPTQEYGDEFGDYGIGLGLEQKNVGPISLLEVGLTINMMGRSSQWNNGTQNDKYTESGSDIDLRIGGDLAGENGKFGRAELGLTMDGSTHKAEPQNAPAANNYVEGKNSGFGYNLGYAMGKSGDKGMGLVGLMLYGRSDTGDAPFYSYDNNKDTYSETRLELATAAEGKVNGWLTVRAGLSSNLWYSFSEVYEESGSGFTGKYVYTESDRWNAYGNYSYNNLAKASFGTTVSLGDLRIDGVLNQDFLYTGGALISGLGGLLNTQVSATWGW